MLSNIICQNALLTKCSFHEEHFLGEHFAKEYGRAFLSKQNSILAFTDMDSATRHHLGLGTGPSSVEVEELREDSNG